MAAVNSIGATSRSDHDNRNATIRPGRRLLKDLPAPCLKPTPKSHRRDRLFREYRNAGEQRLRRADHRVFSSTGMSSPVLSSESRYMT